LRLFIVLCAVELLDTVDYVSNSSGSVVFRTCDEEKRKVVFQIGTADPILALQAAERVYELTQACIGLTWLHKEHEPKYVLHIHVYGV
jgi:tRNA-dihydrouridine synthase